MPIEAGVRSKASAERGLSVHLFRPMLRASLAISSVLLVATSETTSAAETPTFNSYWQVRTVDPDGSTVIRRSDTSKVVVLPQTHSAAMKMATQDGFRLRGGNRDGWYLYNSSLEDNHLDRCSATCAEVGLVKTSISQYLYGGSSTRWRIKVSALIIRGPAYSFGAQIWCGVNVPRRSDWTCDTHESDADDYQDIEPAWDSLKNSSGSEIFSFGSGERQYAKFPMVETEVSWPGIPAPASIGKYRGWDTRYFDSSPGAGGQARAWLLPPVTGTGG